MSAWSVDPIIAWMLHRGRHIDEPQQLLGEICARVRQAGMPLNRVNVFIGTLHPQYFGFALKWEDGDVILQYGEHSQISTAAYQSSPMVKILAGDRVIRSRLRGSEPLEFPVLEELRAEGFTDYVLAELVFSSGSRNGVSLASRTPEGFSDHDINEVQRLLHLFALLMENHTNRGIAANLLDTYLGPISGARVLEGKIQRGDGDHIDAVIWFSDLRNSTPLAESLGHQVFLELLNDYFEATAGAVLEHGGEVLRFIGDASLAVFPINNADEAGQVCATAIAAARDARGRVAAANDVRRARGLREFGYGVGVHRGHVLYGNIGTPERLEFSVVGAAANETARIEALCKETGNDVVVSESVVRHLPQQADELSSLGRQTLRGVGREIEVFALAR
jgi:adenylate cyclase